MKNYIAVADIREKIASAIFYKKNYQIKLEMTGDSVLTCVVFEDEPLCYVVTRRNGSDYRCRSVDALNKLLQKIHPINVDLFSVPAQLSIT